MVNAIVLTNEEIVILLNRYKKMDSIAQYELFKALEGDIESIKSIYLTQIRSFVKVLAKYEVYDEEKDEKPNYKLLLNDIDKVMSNPRPEIDGEEDS